VRTDPGEKTNVANDEAGKGSRYAAILSDWLVKMHPEMPKPNPAFDQSEKTEDRHLDSTGATEEWGTADVLGNCAG
jgi:hypothetical protein